MSTVLETILAKLQVKDEATGPLDKIAKSTGGLFSKLTSVGDAVTSLAGVGALMGGALSLHGAIESTEKYLKNLKEVHELTGATASETDFLFSSARQAGVEYDQMQQTMFLLSKRAQVVEEKLAGLGGGAASGGLKAMKAMGVNVEKGPVAALEQLSDQVKAGKLGAQQLMATFRIPKDQVNDFTGFLEKLDKAKLNQAKAGKLPGLVTDQDMSIFNQIEESRHRIFDGFNRIKLLIAKEVLPVIADMLARFEKNLPSWIDTAQKFGAFLRDHLETAIGLAKTFGKIMVANSALKFFTGGDIASWVKAGPQVAKGLVEFLGKSNVFKTIGMKASGMVGRTIATSPVLKALGLSTAKVAGSAGVAAGSMAMLATALAAVAAVVGIAVAAWKGIENNINGVGDRVRAVWDTIQSRLEGIADIFAPVVDYLTNIFGGDGTLVGFIEYVAASGFAMVLEDIEYRIHIFQTALMFLAERFRLIAWAAQDVWTSITASVAEAKVKVIETVKGWADSLVKALSTAFDKIWSMLPEFVQYGLSETGKAAKKAMSGNGSVSKVLDDVGGAVKNFADYAGSGKLKEDLARGMLGDQNVNDWKRLWDKSTEDAQNRTKQRALRKTREDASDDAKKRKQDPNFDFRYSRFDIKQNFAEGFDPDRIAVAFSNDLANMGEMRSQSGFSPLTATGR